MRGAKANVLLISSLDKCEALHLQGQSGHKIFATSKWDSE